MRLPNLDWIVNCCRNNRIWKRIRKKFARSKPNGVRCKRINFFEYFHAFICDRCAMKASVVRYYDGIARVIRWSASERVPMRLGVQRPSNHVFHGTNVCKNQRGIYMARFRRSLVDKVECERGCRARIKQHPWWIVVWNKDAYTEYRY